MAQQGQKPLRANFRGPQRVFDSEAAQREFGWTDEERLQVERHLLSHKSYGMPGWHGVGGLYLAPGEVIPPEHEGVVRTDLPGPRPGVMGSDTPATPPEEARCIFIATGVDDVEQCESAAVEGQSYCAHHLELAAAAEGSPKPKTKPKATAAA
jgi:hypothetical protein